MISLQKINDELEKLVPVFSEFSREMQTKLAVKLVQGADGWDDPEWTIEMATKALEAHVKKGDFVYVANFAMFIWFKQQQEKQS